MLEGRGKGVRGESEVDYVVERRDNRMGGGSLVGKKSRWQVVALDTGNKVLNLVSGTKRRLMLRKGK